MKKTKSVIAVVLAVVSIFCMMSSAYAISNKVSASGHSEICKTITAAEAKANSNWTKGYYKAKATGYITSTTYHYTNTALVQLGQDVKYSGRVWGKGKIVATTSYWKGGCAFVEELFGSRVYYGWSK